jgi:RimJ/RimL family protein N-acetyltransferase
MSTARTDATVPGEVVLRPLTELDLPTLFEQQRVPESNRMAGFTAANPDDRDAFMAKWTRILGEGAIPLRAIVADGALAGSVLCWTDEELGRPEVSYWLGREHWGKGIATRALSLFLEEITERPIYGRAAADNIGSIRVLEKCGFRHCGVSRGFASARGEEIDEVILELASSPAPNSPSR